MPGTIHPTAILGPGVELGPETGVGPFAVFEGRVRTGAGCRFATGVVIGAAPMDRDYRGEETRVEIGRATVFHEYATVHRSVGEGTATVIGDGNYVMAYVHIAHNCRVGDGCTLTNGVQLAGYVEVGDRANVGGLAGVHQHCRIGELAMVGACSYVNKDIPPFLTASGNPCRVRGVNRVGLERAGRAGAVPVLRQAFRLVYRSDLNLAQAVDRIARELVPAAGDGRRELERLLEFIDNSARGIELRTGAPGAEQEES